MNVNIELYRTFCTVAAIGNITKAAEVLLVSQPAVTKTIHTLEDQLGAQLFTRTKHGVSLTEEGKALYSNVRQGIDAINNAENKFYELKNLEMGKIKIGASATVTKYFLIPYLEKFHKLYPNIDIQIVNNLTRELVAELKNGTVDIVVLNLPTELEKDIKIIPCKDVTDTFVASPEYAKTLPKVIKLGDLNNYPLILQKGPSNTRNFIDRFMIENKIVLKPKIEIVSYALVLEFTKIGFGIGYATKEFAKKELDNGTFIEVKTMPALPSRQIGIAILDNEYMSFACKKLISIIKEEEK